MNFLDTPHKKKSAGLTAITAVLLIILFFVLGLTYYDPPVSYGMEVNFGALTQTNKNFQSKIPVESKAQPSRTKISNKKLNKKVLIPDVFTEEKSTLEALKNNDIKKENQLPIENKENKRESTPVNTKFKISETTKNVVSNLLKNNKEINDEESEGYDAVKSDQGKIEGDPYSRSYYDSNGINEIENNYGLNGRTLKSNGKVVQDCNQEGTVVVRITVDKKGNVIYAEPGVKGSTNTHPCLMSPAKKTALLHKWYPDDKAPEQQTGFVLIKFKLGE
tara:strand:+ start:10814 stop:11641 length:828 start_codon:yes stop_codon:yes gene_type:complete